MVKLVYPSQISSKVAVHETEMKFSKDKSIYDTVESYEKNIFPKIDDKLPVNRCVTERIPLATIINLHNHDGIRSIAQIKSMVRQLRSGSHILARNGLPNIKLTRSTAGEWIIFDGHHTLLAYMKAGKNYLDEVPHIIINDYNQHHMTDNEILVFFGRHAGKFNELRHDWKNYTINWQAPFKEQLCSRIQRNMGELANAVFSFYSAGYINQ